MVLLTAGTAGIGLGIAERLGREGATLFLCSRKKVRPSLLQLPASYQSCLCLCSGVCDPTAADVAPKTVDVVQRLQVNVDAAVKQLRDAGVAAVGCVAHVGSRDDLKKFVQSAVSIHGRIDILVSNAAVNPAAGLILDMPDAAIDKILDINVKSAIWLAKEAKPYMSKVCQTSWATPVQSNSPSLGPLHCLRPGRVGQRGSVVFPRVGPGAVRGAGV